MSQSQGGSSQTGPISGLQRDPIDKCSVDGQDFIRQLRSSVHESLQVLNDYTDGSANLINQTKLAAAAVVEKYEKVDQTARLSQKCTTGPLLMGGYIHLLEEAGQSLPSSEKEAKLLEQYEWGEKNREYAQYLHAFMIPPRKSNCVSLPKQIISLNRYTMEQITSHISDMQRRHAPFLKMVLSEESTQTQQVLLVDVCQGRSKELDDQTTVFRVCLVMRSMIPEWVNVIGPDELFQIRNSKVVLHEDSVHEVFRKLSTYLKSVLLTAGPTVLHYVSWLIYNRYLFSVPCASCKQYLKNGLPALCFDTKHVSPHKLPVAYHDSCKP